MDLDDRNERALITNPDQTTCEFSLVVSDAVKGQGLVLANNPNMLRLMRSLGFHVGPFPEDTDFKLVTKAL